VIAKIHHEVADLLRCPLAVRVRGGAQQVHRPAADLQRKVGPGRGVGVSTGPFLRNNPWVRWGMGVVSRPGPGALAHLGDLVAAERISIVLSR
jgi:hypothetical protein